MAKKVGKGYFVDWNGPQVALRVRRALGRGLIAIGENTAVLAKQHAHVLSGTMRRSIHTAERNYVGANDERDASNSDIPNIKTPSTDGPDWILEVGSWVPYACVEEVGRGHRFIQPAVSTMQGGRSRAIMRQAFAEEGLR